jgi:hypothetical protein
MSTLANASAVLASIEDLGLLLVSDPKRKNAVQILTGAFPRGSWWSHPEANRIYHLLQTVEQHPDVLQAKLLAGKATFIHRRLWPDLLAVASAREGWQMDGLSPGAAKMLASLEAATGAETDADAEQAEPPSRTAIKELEARLLARSESVHSPTGQHVTRLESWTTWATRVGCAPAPSVAQSKLALAAAATQLGPPPAALPWVDG